LAREVRWRNDLLVHKNPEWWGESDKLRFSYQLRDVDVVRALVERDAGFFQHLPPAMRADRSVLTIALRSYGQAITTSGGVLSKMPQANSPLQWASEELHADREVVELAVTQDGSALGYAAHELCADRDIVLAAVANNGWAYRDASADLRADINVATAAVSQAGYVLQFMSKELRNNHDVVVAAVRQAGRQVLKFASRALLEDDAFLATVQSGSS
jgi:hypothetical protein